MLPSKNCVSKPCLFQLLYWWKNGCFLFQLNVLMECQRATQQPAVQSRGRWIVVAKPRHRWKETKERFDERCEVQTLWNEKHAICIYLSPLIFKNQKLPKTPFNQISGQTNLGHTSHTFETVSQVSVSEGWSTQAGHSSRWWPKVMEASWVGCIAPKKPDEWNTTLLKFLKGHSAPLNLIYSLGVLFSCSMLFGCF